MKAILLLSALILFCTACTPQFETKLIDEVNLFQQSDVSEKEVHKPVVNGYTKSKTWVLSKSTKSKIKQIEPFQNVIVIDSVADNYIIYEDGEGLLIPKKEVNLHHQTRVVLKELEIYASPDLTFRTTNVFNAGTLLIISSQAIEDFYKIKTVGSKTWFFVLKEEEKLSKNAEEINLANSIREIKEDYPNPVIQQRMFLELKKNSPINRLNWYPEEQEVMLENKEEVDL